MVVEISDCVKVWYENTLLNSFVSQRGGVGVAIVIPKTTTGLH